jgi:hypothetical protein
MRKQNGPIYVLIRPPPFNIGQFTRLQSLTLYNLNSVEMEQFLHHITSSCLVSLTINMHGREDNRVLSVIFPVVIQFNLRKLHLNNLDYKTEGMSWPIQSTLEHLTIRDCTYRECRTILCNSCHLRTFRMRNCIMGNIDQTGFPFSVKTSNSAKRQRTSIDYTSISNEIFNNEASSISSWWRILSFISRKHPKYKRIFK